MAAGLRAVGHVIGDLGDVWVPSCAPSAMRSRTFSALRATCWPSSAAGWWSCSRRSLTRSPGRSAPSATCLPSWGGGSPRSCAPPPMPRPGSCARSGHVVAELGRRVAAVLRAVGHALAEVLRAAGHVLAELGRRLVVVLKAVAHQVARPIRALGHVLAELGRRVAAVVRAAAHATARLLRAVGHVIVQGFQLAGQGMVRLLVALRPLAFVSGRTVGRVARAPSSCSWPGCWSSAWRLPRRAGSPCGSCASSAARALVDRVARDRRSPRAAAPPRRPRGDGRVPGRRPRAGRRAPRRGRGRCA